MTILEIFFRSSFVISIFQLINVSNLLTWFSMVFLSILQLYSTLTKNVVIADIKRAYIRNTCAKSTSIKGTYTRDA